MVALLDFALEFDQGNGGTLGEFLEHWESAKDNLKLVSPEGQDAVQVMTIHKSKGLQFPFVIFPLQKAH